MKQYRIIINRSTIIVYANSIEEAEIKAKFFN
jgi:hypothetical protein